MCIFLIDKNRRCIRIKNQSFSRINLCVNNGQKTIDIRPHARYNIGNLIRK